MSKKVTKRLKSEAVKDYRKMGMSLRDVAAKHGVSAESVRRWAGYRTRPRGTKYPILDKSAIIASSEVYDIKPVISPNHINARNVWSKTEDEILKDAVIDNLTIRETVELLGRSEGSIMNRKSMLVKRGFIDKNLRFKPDFGKSDSKNTKPQLSKSVVKTIVKNAPPVKKVEEKTGSSINIEKIGLSDLAKLVKDHGVGVTLVLSQQGTEVRFHS